MLRIATWNVNSIKSRLSHLLQYLSGPHSPDILLLQELKCQESAFPFENIEDAGYNVVVSGQKTYNGVAVLSRFPVSDVITQLPGDEQDEQARYIEGVVSVSGGAIRVASVYVPNGSSPDSDKFRYKMRFFDRLYDHARTLMSYQEMLVIGGDYNVAPQLDIDVYDAVNLDGSICCHKDERAKFRALIGLGLTDIYRAANQNAKQYSWWDYRGGGWQQNKGMRIDHLLLSPEAADLADKSGVEADIRAQEKPSDHAPVWCTLNVNG